jgi:hypothetical protein
MRKRNKPKENENENENQIQGSFAWKHFCFRCALLEAEALSLAAMMISGVEAVII